MVGFKCFEKVWKKTMRKKGVSAKTKKMLYTKEAKKVCRV